MEGLWDKYNRIKEVFYRDFVYDSSYTKQASCIPLSSVKNGVVFQGGISDYSEGSGTGGSTNGSGKGGGGYGGGGGGVRYSMVYAGAGGDGTVLIRGRRYKS
jgi:hypothetical protein